MILAITNYQDIAERALGLAPGYGFSVPAGVGDYGLWPGEDVVAPQVAANRLRVALHQWADARNRGISVSVARYRKRGETFPSLEVYRREET